MRLLAVHAHPDDETLFTGALLATVALLGEVRLVTCTRGERGEVIGAGLAHLEGDGPALAAHREGELAAALEALGVREHLFLDALLDRRVEDSGMRWVADGVAGPAEDVGERAFVRAPLEPLAAALAAELDRWRPDVVVTYGPDGGYGHPDHVRAHELTMRAVALAAVEPLVLWAVAAPRREQVCAAGGPRLEVPLGPVVEALAAAMRAHETQVQDVVVGPGTVDFALSNGVPQRLGPVEVHEPGGPVRPFTWPALLGAREWPVP